MFRRTLEHSNADGLSRLPIQHNAEDVSEEAPEVVLLMRGSKDERNGENVRVVAGDRQSRRGDGRVVCAMSIVSLITTGSSIASLGVGHSTMG